MTASHEGVDDEALQLRGMCWDNAIHTFGTSYVFQRRTRVMKRRLMWVNYVGVAIPVTVGAIVLTFGVFSSLGVIIAVAGLIALGQVVVNLWAIIGGWVERHSYSSESAVANDSLSMRYQDMGRNPPDEIVDLRHEYEKLQIEDKYRRDRDMHQDVSESEKRMGMRAALRKMQRSCAGCHKVPTSMRPLDCDVCGNFKYRDA